MYLLELRNKLLDLQLQFLWEQWSDLGLSSQQKNRSNTIIDPESLLLYSLEVAQYDCRLFDEIFDWCKLNGHFLAIPRIKSLMKEFPFDVSQQVGTLAEILSVQSRNKKWRKLIELGTSSPATALFYLKDGKELPIVGTPDVLFEKHGLLRDEQKLRGYSVSFDTSKSSCLLLKLRALMGISARCEIIGA